MTCMSCTDTAYRSRAGQNNRRRKRVLQFESVTLQQSQPDNEKNISQSQLDAQVANHRKRRRRERNLKCRTDVEVPVVREKVADVPSRKLSIEQ